MRPNRCTACSTAAWACVSSATSSWTKARFSSVPSPRALRSFVEVPARRNDAVASPKGGHDSACANSAACARNKPDFAHVLIPLHCSHLTNARLPDISRT